MFYLLASLTFLTSILIYSLYPRADGVTTFDMPTARTAAMELAAQHSAALQAATVLTTDEEKNTIMFYKNWGSGQIDQSSYTAFLPSTFTPNPNEYYRPSSQILCVDNKTAASTSSCAIQNADIENGFYGTTDFVITHISLPALANTYGEYTANLVPRALGQLTHFTDYDEKRHLTTNCGLILKGKITNRDFDPNNAEYSLTDTRYGTVNLPYAFTAETPNFNDNQEYVACITRVSVAYDKKTNKVIVPLDRTKN